MNENCLVERSMSPTAASTIQGLPSPPALPCQMSQAIDWIPLEPLGFGVRFKVWVQVEALGSGPDAQDVRMTMAGIEESPFPEFRATELAGRVAAVCGVHNLAGLAASSEERVSFAAGEPGQTTID